MIEWLADESAARARAAAERKLILLDLHGPT
jgi:hypothetical protein